MRLPNKDDMYLQGATKGQYKTINIMHAGESFQAKKLLDALKQ